MKKTIEILSVMSILLASHNLSAGSNDRGYDLPTVTFSKGVQFCLITVTDQSFKPIKGAVVNAPCTGLKPIATDETGTATFSISGACNCDQQPAYISTEAGCNIKIVLSCESTNEAICDK